MRVLADTLTAHEGPFIDVAPGEVLTYRQAAEVAARIGGWLRKREINRGDSVAVAMSNSPRTALVWFGLLREGVAVVPLNPALPDEEIAYILRMSESKMVICDALTARNATRWIEEIGLRLEAVIADDEPWQQYQAVDEPYVDADDIAVIFFTSGTSGRPKGAMLTHRALLANVVGCAQSFRLDATAAFACPIPIFHSFAATVCVFLPAYLGGRLYLHVPQDIAGFLERLARLPGRRILVGVPSHLAAMAASGGAITNVRFIVSGGAALPGELGRRLGTLTGAPVYEGYGTTECGPVISAQTPGRDNAPGSVGLPISGVEVEIRSSDNNTLLAGEIGEIVVRTPALMSGYYDLDAATKTSIKGGWFCTGDLGYKSPIGELFIVDRLSDAISVKGITVLPQKIETALNKHPAVVESAVVGIPDGGGGEIPWAFVRCRSDQTITASELIRFLRDHLPVYAVPRGIEFRETLPKTVTGKILKRTLRQKWL